jgi:hypothetical protein
MAFTHLIALLRYRGRRTGRALMWRVLLAMTLQSAVAPAARAVPPAPEFFQALEAGTAIRAGSVLDAPRAAVQRVPVTYLYAASSALSLPCGHQVQPSASCWGSPGATPGRGWFDSRMYRLTTSPVTVAVDTRLKGCAALHAQMHITSAHTCPFHHEYHHR